MNFVVEKSTQQEGSARAKGVTLPTNFRVPLKGEVSAEPESSQSASRASGGAENNLSGGVDGNENAPAEIPENTISLKSPRVSMAASGSSAPPAQNFC